MHSNNSKMRKRAAHDTLLLTLRYQSWLPWLLETMEEQIEELRHDMEQFEKTLFTGRSSVNFHHMS